MDNALFRFLRRSILPGMLICCGILSACAGSRNTDRQSGPAGFNDLQTAPITNTDACAGNLHDISGALLLYFLTHHDLPEHLEDLGPIPGHDGSAALICPVSQRPYIYNPSGILLPEKGARVVLYDSAPAHSGMRWAITVEDTQPHEPLVTKVIALPESIFMFHSRTGG